MKRLLTVFFGLAILFGAVFGCRFSGKSYHMAQNSPYVDARTGQLIEEDSDEGGIFDFLFDLVWGAIFGSSDQAS